MVTGPDLKGVLIAGYGINEALANDIRKLTHSEVAFLTRPPGPDLPALGLVARARRRARCARPWPTVPAAGATRPSSSTWAASATWRVLVPLKAATGETVGSVLALRSLAVEMAAFRQFRTSLVLVSLVVMVLALGLAYLSARPHRRARCGAWSGSWSGRATAPTRARSRWTRATRSARWPARFNSLLADLREKEQMIGFLREGMTVLRKGSGVTARHRAQPGAR